LDDDEDDEEDEFELDEEELLLFELDSELEKDLKTAPGGLLGTGRGVKAPSPPDVAPDAGLAGLLPPLLPLGVLPPEDPVLAGVDD